MIAGINYRPETSGVAPYTTAVAEHLARRGARVTVLTGVPHYPEWRVPQGYSRVRMHRSRERGVEVIRAPLFVPDRQSALLRAAYEAGLLLHLPFATLAERPDLIVGIVPSLSGGVVARALAGRFKVPYGLIFQDLMGRAAAQSGISGGGRVAAATTRIEWSLARAASAVGVVSGDFVPYLRMAGVDEQRICALPNWSRLVPARRDRETTRRALGWAAGSTIALHAGNMGLKQGLEQIVSAARMAAEQAPELRFVLMGDGHQRRHLEALAAGLSSVTFLPFQPEERLGDVLGAADVLLLSERSSVHDMSLPSKLTAYLASGRPIVAAVAPGGATEREMRRTGASLLVEAGDAAALVEAIVALRMDPTRAAELARNGRRYAETELSQDAALLRYEAFVELVAGGRPG
ncbi:MAG: WcaI family glycosyltransferase [Candidatus Limnocylindrales bacterium]